ncbi:hypothetical protein V1260_02180 [Brachybacterium sp. J144]|uniref:hypothetical protein n=1 Tax=Brachybacterium sp. J144 TaxID=3116487 RepID=UPI002E76F6C9|nr:hypothetical protein [Brachybacterium sp. J144]MEE1649593.1 hypothetical protein [Brachybacterium sp. J144]
MSDRHVTAVVLLSRATTEPSLRATLAGAQGQSRPVDRLVAVAPQDLPEDCVALLRDERSAGGLDHVLTVPAGAARTAALRAVLRLLDETDGAREGSVAADHVDHAVSSAPEVSSGEAPASRGRRASDIDPDAVERERTQELAALAQVPVRLREDGPRTGRRAGRSAEDESWLWCVVDGSTPGLDALEAQLELVAESPTTAVVGTKRVAPAAPSSGVDSAAENAVIRTAEEADALVDVGLTLTHGGRIITGVDAGEVDQGQADWRQDVLAVPLAGMLVRESTLRAVGVLDPDLPGPWAEIDLCRRVWRGGDRVAVQSRARTLHPLPTRPRLERLQEQRTGQLLLLLKHRSLFAALLMILLSPLSALLRTAGAIAASEPRRAGAELRAWAGMLRRAPRVLQRGRRDRRLARVPARRLAPLYLPRGEAARRRFEDLATRLLADDDRRRTIRRTTWGIAGTHHGQDDADFGRHAVWTAVVALLATVLGLVALRGLFGRGELSGPALRSLPDDLALRWRVGWSDWIPGGLGERGPADPLLRLLGSIPVPGSFLVEALILTALPLSALLSWWAAGAITRAVGARLALVVAWTLAPSLLSALTTGAWPLLLVHLLLPLLALLIGRAIGLPHKASQASPAAAAAGGLVLLVIGAVTPALVLLTALALLLILPAVPGRRRRLALVLLPSLALHLPYLPQYLGHPGLMLSVGGMPLGGDLPERAELLALWPVSPGVQTVLAPLVGEMAAFWLPLALPLAPIVLGALAAPFLAGQAGRAGRFGLLLAATALGAALLALELPAGLGGELLVPFPPHALLSAALLALCVGAAASFDALARREEGESRARRPATVVLASLVAACCVIAVAGWTLLLPGQLRVERTETGDVPAAAADQGRTEARSRVLSLSQEDDGSVTAHLVVHGGDSAVQHAAILDQRDVAAARAGEVDADPASTVLRDTVALMLSSGADPAEADALREATASLAVAYVVVEGDPVEQQDLMATLDASSTLEKVTEGTRGGMWRVVDSPPRAVVTGSEGSIALASEAIDVSGRVEPAAEERTVILSERADSGWRASIDGTALEPTTVDGWAQGFVLPAGTGGEISIERAQPLLLAERLLLGAAVLLTVLIAVPWRPRARAEEMYG